MTAIQSIASCFHGSFLRPLIFCLFISSSFSPFSNIFFVKKSLNSRFTVPPIKWIPSLNYYKSLLIFFYKTWLTRVSHTEKANMQSFCRYRFIKSHKNLPKIKNQNLKHWICYYWVEDPVGYYSEWFPWLGPNNRGSRTAVYKDMRAVYLGNLTLTKTASYKLVFLQKRERRNGGCGRHCCSVARSCPTFCDSHGLQHARPSCPSPAPR